MPDLPELYKRLDAALEALHKSENNQVVITGSAMVSALCAAIEVKQSQELHDLLNQKEEKDEQAARDRALGMAYGMKRN